MRGALQNFETFFGEDILGEVLLSLADNLS
jgi:hypothetical protein